MDTIVFEKVWQDKELLELKISARSEFVTAYQKCYIQDTALEEIAEKICDYMKDYKQSCYLEFGHKSGNYSPEFSMCLMAADNAGHVKIEVDIEIADNDLSKMSLLYKQFSVSPSDFKTDDRRCKIQKIDSDSNELKTANNATAHMYIASPFKSKANKNGKKKTSLFSTHPSIDDRIEALRNLK